MRILLSISALTQFSTVKALAPKLAKLTQTVYDAWDEDDKDTYAGGGICHLIAEKIVDFLSDKRIECSTVSSSHEQHVYVVAKLRDGCYSIDVPHHIYELGGGFSWTKVPGVKFDAADIVFYRISADPKEYENQIAEY